MIFGNSYMMTKDVEIYKFDALKEFYRKVENGNLDVVWDRTAIGILPANTIFLCLIDRRSWEEKSKLIDTYIPILFDGQIWGLPTRWVKNFSVKI